MAYPNVLVIGGSGFIGRHLVAKLVALGCLVTVPSRRPGRAHHLRVLPSADVVQANVHDDKDLERVMHGMHVVINLVGILHGRPAGAGTRYGPAFAQAHVELPRRIAAAAQRQGIRRFLHVSALGADPNGPSMYLRSKGDGEAAVLSQSALDCTVFRPSVVFGEEDRFLNLFASLQRYLPVVFLGAADARFQPIYVQDVAWAIANALGNASTRGKVYELAGPSVYTLRELVRLAGEYAGHARPIVALPPSLARLQAWVLEHLPGGPLMSRDNLDSMKIDNVAAGPIAPELAITPTALEAIAPSYLRR